VLYTLKNNYSYKEILVSFWMIDDAYLMHANSGFERFLQGIGVLPRGESYHLYFPMQEMLVGNFSNGGLAVSDKLFIKSLNSYEKKNFDNKIAKNKFVRNLGSNLNYWKNIIDNTTDYKEKIVRFN
jgi:hypothetical protein